MMGNTSKLARANEQPGFKARFSGFWMDASDVTNAQFAAFVRATGYVTTVARAGLGKPVRAASVQTIVGIQCRRLGE